jgi:hypothetical protein
LGQVFVDLVLIAPWTYDGFSCLTQPFDASVANAP